jgi:alkylation response protein AidB-like acyl-CoA dehydrogenase
VSLPDRSNPYAFDDFLELARGLDFYGDDPFLQKLVRHYCGPEWPELHEKLLAFSPRVSFRWRDLADYIARPQRLPYLEHYDAHNHRVDRIVRPAETRQLEEEIFAEGLFSRKVTPWEHLTKRLLLHQIGEAGVLCPIACTEGLVALIRTFEDSVQPEALAILEHCSEGLDGNFGLGAQFMSEIQGGSDIPSNLLEAEPAGDHYLLYGSKFFCSAMQADYSVVTAKVTGSDKVGTFVVPSWLPGDKERERRNGQRINRLKWKMGTSELPTAEIEYQGAVAYAVGPTHKGVANAVGIVLTLSRIAVGVASAASMLRAAREAVLYSEFRDVFGRKICQHPLALSQLRELARAAQRTTAAVYKVYALFIELGMRLQAGLASDEPLPMRRRRFLLRELIIMQKLITAYEAVDVLRKAMSIFGGHGVIEDFSSLPRLYRDAAVNELWEGPRNVLLMQIFRDLARAAEWYPPAEFMADLLAGAPEKQIAAMAIELSGLLQDPPFDSLEAAQLERAAAWENLVKRMFRAYQEAALAEVGPEPLVDPAKLVMPELWK